MRNKNKQNIIYFIVLIIFAFWLVSCKRTNINSNNESHHEKINTNYNTSAYRYKIDKSNIDESNKVIYHQYLSQLTPQEQNERMNNYCGRFGDKIIKFRKEYLFMPMGYEDISFLKPNGWKAKMRWCNDSIISFSIVVDWPNLEPARSMYGFNQLDWGTYDQYLMSLKNNKNRDYSHTVIYVYGLIDKMDNDFINSNNLSIDLKPYLKNLFKKYHLHQNNHIIKRKDLNNLEQVDIPISNTVATLYWHRMNDNKIDLIIECAPVPERLYSWCTSYFFPKDIPNVISSFVVTEERIGDWIQLIKKASQLYHSFIVKEKENNLNKINKNKSKI